VAQLEVEPGGEKLSWRGPTGHRGGPTSQNSETC